MKLTIEQLSKLTKLSIPTLRVYVSRQKLGTKVGNNRVFTQADVQKLLKGSKKASSTAPGKTARKKSPAPRKAVRVNKPATKPAKAASKPSASAASRTTRVETRPPAPKVSFWNRLFGGGKQKQKINLLQAKSTK